MEIDRHDSRNLGESEKRLTYCLGVLEEADEFSEGIDWQTYIADGLTVEELIGALVAAEVDLDE